MQRVDIPPVCSTAASPSVVPGPAGCAPLGGFARRGARLVAASLLAWMLPVGASAQTPNPDCQPFPVPGSWAMHYLDRSNTCYADLAPDGLGGLNGADGADIADWDNDGDLDVITPWEQSGEVVIALNPGPATVRTVDQWNLQVLVGDKGGVEDAIFGFIDDLDAIPDYAASAAELGSREVFVHSKVGGSWDTQRLPHDGKNYMRLQSGDIMGDGGCNDLVSGGKDNDGISGQIWFHQCPTGWQPGDDVDHGPAGAWLRHTIKGDMVWIMELDLFDMDADGDLDVVFSDRKKVGWMENPKIDGGGDPTVKDDWVQHVIESGGSPKTGGKDQPYRWSHLVDIADNGTYPNGDPIPELLVATNYGFDRGVVARWYELDPNGAGVRDDGSWVAREVVAEGGELPFFAHGGDLVSKAVVAYDLTGDGRKELVLTARGGTQDGMGGTQPDKGVGVYMLSLPPGATNPPRCDPCTQAADEWLWSPIAQSFPKMKYDNIQVADLDGDGDPDIVTVEEEVDGKGLGSIWFENPSSPLPQDDAFIVEENSVAVPLDVVANDAGHDLDACSVSVVGVSVQPATTVLTPLAGPSCGRIAITPDPAYQVHTVLFDYQICRDADPANCSGASVRVDVVPDLLDNGSFELPQVGGALTLNPGQLTDWTSVGQVAIAEWGAWEPAEGNQSLQLRALGAPAGTGATISQTFTLEAQNVPHAVQFSMAAEPVGTAGLTVRATTPLLGVIAEAAYTFDGFGRTDQDLGWETRTLWFQGGTENVTLEFLGSAFGAAARIDDVTVTDVPLLASAIQGDTFAITTNQTKTIDLADYVSFTSGAPDFGTALIVAPPNPLCGSLVQTANGIYKFTPAPGVKQFIPGACASVTFQLEVQVTSSLPALVDFTIDLTPIAGATPDAKNDLYLVNFEDIDEPGESFTMRIFDNDVDADCPDSKICYGDPTYTPPAEFASCVKVGTNQPKRIRCTDFQLPNPVAGDVDVVFSYQVCDFYSPVDGCDTATVTIRVHPDLAPPDLQIDLPVLDFGEVGIGTTTQRTLEFSNPAGDRETLTVLTLEIENDPQGVFEVVGPSPGNGLPFFLAAGETQQVTLAASPDQVLPSYQATLKVWHNDPDEYTYLPLTVSGVAYAGAAHYGDADPLSEGWVVPPGDAGTAAETTAFFADPDFPGVSSFEVASTYEARRYQIPGPTSADAWILRSRVRLATLDRNATNGAALRVDDEIQHWWVRPATDADGVTTLHFSGGATPFVVPNGQIGVSDYVLIEIVRDASTGLAHVFANGAPALSDWPGNPTPTTPATPVVSFGDLRAALQGPPSQGRYEVVEFFLNGAPACDNTLDDDADGRTDTLDPDCHAATDPTENAADHDGDGLLDGFESLYGFDPEDANEGDVGRVDGQDDLDGDQLGNAAEQAAGTHPGEADSDLDGLDDGEELSHQGFDPEQVISGLVNNPFQVVAADVDGDGDPDLLSVSRNDDKVAWYANDGSGSFGPQQIISTSADDPRAVVATDLDGDGNLDVVSASFADDKIAWYRGLGGGAFDATQNVISTSVDEAISVFAADLDGDGDPDVLAASRAAGGILWYENIDGTGRFSAAKPVANAPLTPIRVMAADVDGDGDLDALTASLDDDTVAWYENFDGAGSFGPQQVITALADGARWVETADLDGDGDLDVLSASSLDDTIAWYANDGTGSFGVRQVISSSANNARAVFAADVDGDGDPDVLSASGGDDKVAWYRNDGSGGFPGFVNVITTTVNNIFSATTADLDGDGDPDVITTSAAGDRIGFHVNRNISDPNEPDTDGDGLLDGFEVDHGFDPRVAGEGALDPDGDSLDNLGEQANGTNPHVADTDGDGWSDGAEVARGTNPADGLDFPLSTDVPALGLWGRSLLLLLLLGGALRRQLLRRHA